VFQSAPVAAARGAQPPVPPAATAAATAAAGWRAGQRRGGRGGRCSGRGGPAPLPSGGLVSEAGGVCDDHPASVPARRTPGPALHYWVRVTPLSPPRHGRSAPSARAFVRPGWPANLESLKTLKQSGYSPACPIENVLGWVPCIRHLPFKMHYGRSSLHVFAPTGE